MKPPEKSRLDIIDTAQLYAREVKVFYALLAILVAIAVWQFGVPWPGGTGIGDDPADAEAGKLRRARQSQWLQVLRLVGELDQATRELGRRDPLAEQLLREAGVDDLARRLTESSGPAAPAAGIAVVPPSPASDAAPIADASGAMVIASGVGSGLATVASGPAPVAPTPAGNAGPSQPPAPGVTDPRPRLVSLLPALQRVLADPLVTRSDLAEIAQTRLRGLAKAIELPLDEEEPLPSFDLGPRSPQVRLAPVRDLFSYAVPIASGSTGEPGAGSDRGGAPDGGFGSDRTPAPVGVADQHGSGPGAPAASATEQTGMPHDEAPEVENPAPASPSIATPPSAPDSDDARPSANDAADIDGHLRDGAAASAIPQLPRSEPAVLPPSVSGTDDPMLSPGADSPGIP